MWVIILTFVVLSYGFINYQSGKRITENFTSGTMHGWYRGEILCSRYFNFNTTRPEEIKALREDLKKELDLKVKKYKACQ